MRVAFIAMTVGALAGMDSALGVLFTFGHRLPGTTQHGRACQLAFVKRVMNMKLFVRATALAGLLIAGKPSFAQTWTQSSAPIPNLL